MSQILEMRRILYDQEFLDKGCPPELYNADTNIDDTFWTFVSSFMIVFLALLFALTLFLIFLQRFVCNRRTHDPLLDDHRAVHTRTVPDNLPPKYYTLLISYFILVALGFGTAGLGHYKMGYESIVLDKLVTFLNSKGFDNHEFVQLECLFLGSASMTWITAAIMEYCYAICNLYYFPNFLQWFWLIVSLLVVTVLVATYSLFGTGVTIVVSIVLVLVMAIWQCCKYRQMAYLMDVVALLIYLAGIIVQVSLRGVCGSEGYKNCFQQCPLPNPTQLNHNAIFHFFVSAFCLLYGISKAGIMLQATAKWDPETLLAESKSVPLSSLA